MKRKNKKPDIIQLRAVCDIPEVLKRIAALHEGDQQPQIRGNAVWVEYRPHKPTRYAKGCQVQDTIAELSYRYGCLVCIGARHKYRRTFEFITQVINCGKEAAPVITWTEAPPGHRVPTLREPPREHGKVCLWQDFLGRPEDILYKNVSN